MTPHCQIPVSHSHSLQAGFWFRWRLSGAYRCYRVSKFAQIDLSKVRSRGYSFQEEILFWCKRVGCRIGETPILFENRRFGASKINMREAASALWILLRLGVGRVRG